MHFELEVHQRPWAQLYGALDEFRTRIWAVARDRDEFNLLMRTHCGVLMSERRGRGAAVPVVRQPVKTPASLSVSEAAAVLRVLHENRRAVPPSGLEEFDRVMGELVDRFDD